MASHLQHLAQQQHLTTTPAGAAAAAAAAVVVYLESAPWHGCTPHPGRAPAAAPGRPGSRRPAPACPPAGPAWCAPWAPSDREQTPRSTCIEEGGEEGGRALGLGARRSCSSREVLSLRPAFGTGRLWLSKGLFCTADPSPLSVRVPLRTIPAPALGPQPTPRAPELRPALREEGVSIQRSREAEHVSGVGEAQVGVRVHELLHAACSGAG